MNKALTMVIVGLLCLSTFSMFSPTVHASVAIMPTRLPSARTFAAAVWDGSNAYIFGGATLSGPLNQILKYNPVTDTISTTSATLPDPVCDMPAVWTGSCAYVFGGYVAPLHTSDKIVRYDPSTNAVTVMSAKLPTYAFPLYSMAAIWDGNHAYLFGGCDGYSYFDSILRYDPVQDQLTIMNARLPTAIKWMSAVWSGQYAYIFGGRTPSGVTDQIVEYDPIADSATLTSATLPEALIATSAVWTGSNAYIFGGRSMENRDSSGIFKYDPMLDSCSSVGENLPSPRGETCAVWAGQSAFIFGGSLAASVQIFDEIVRFSPSRTATKWAVVLGVNEYTDSTENRNGAVISANDMYDLLINTFGFPYVSVHLRTDTVGNSADDVNTDDVVSELNWLITNVIPGDTAVFYYAGHGSSGSGGEEYLVPHDGMGITDIAFAGYINRINTEKLLIILDMSHSGGFITDGQTLSQGIRGIIPSWTNLASATPTGRIVLTACAENVGPWLLRDSKEQRFWHYNTGWRFEMVFTHYLVMGLIGYADSNNDGKVTVEEAFNFARPRTMYSQTPLMYDGYPAYGSSGDLYLG